MEIVPEGCAYERHASMNRIARILTGIGRTPARGVLAVCMACAVAVAGVAARGQSAFQSGEVLQYSLYYNWKFIWVKAGSATMSIVRSTYGDTPAYRTRLLMRGSRDADDYFVLRDTLLSYTACDDLRPLYYSKNDTEGTSYRSREVRYSYTDRKCRVRQSYRRKDGRVTERDELFAAQVYDMLSIMLKARNFSTSGWKPGKRIRFLMADGKGVDNQMLIYRGKQQVKMKNNHKTYTCLKLSFVESDSRGKEKEVITFYVTDDSRHIPVRLDMFLRFGSAKAFFVGGKGMR